MIAAAARNPQMLLDSPDKKKHLMDSHMQSEPVRAVPGRSDFQRSHSLDPVWQKPK